MGACVSQPLGKTEGLVDTVGFKGRLKMREWKMRYGQNARVENAGVG